MNRKKVYKINYKSEFYKMSSLFEEAIKSKFISFKVTMIYAICGGIWVLFSDELLNGFTKDSSIITKIQTYKGWFFVFITSILIYFLIYKSIMQGEVWGIRLKESYEQLEATNEELIAAEEELRSQYEELQKSEEKMKWMAYYDSLTRLPNKILFKDKVNKAVKKSKGEGSRGAIIFFDLDDFKKINDTLGHEYGDELLKEVAKIFEVYVDGNYTISRFGGDEFFVLLPHISSRSEVIEFCENINTIFNTAFQVGEKKIYISASMGVTIFPDDGDHSNILFKNADTAMYEAKAKGKKTYSFFCKSMSESIMRKVLLEKGLRKAIKNKELELNYQPKIDAQTHKIRGFEALLRWRSAELGMISPVEFIPIAEETGLIIEIGEWVIQTACMQDKKWREKGYVYDTMAVNVSPIQFKQPDFYEKLNQQLIENDFNPSFLEIEITESALMKPFDESMKILNKLIESKIQIALDDFGTGYSSFNHLRNFRINVLKIDKSFIDYIDKNLYDKSIAEGIIQMAHKINMEVVAEGVETKEQLSVLQEIKCDLIQGYYFSKALTAIEAEKILLNN